MSFSEDENNLTSENMEQELKVNVEETSVNLGYVKTELDEELEFENRYKIALTSENVFGEISTEHRINEGRLIGFLDGDVMGTGSVKLEVKEENKDFIRGAIEQFHCNKCGGNYQGYCLNCSSLSHILNNLTPNLNAEPVLNTAPLNILEIREVSKGSAVFALKTLPRGIILGPFEGIAPIESTTGLQWKIKDNKFVNYQNGNWMKYIESVANYASKNLDVLQFDGILYFQTSREIQEGEELLVCYNVQQENMLRLNKDEEFYLVPVKREEYPKVFACTLCCLGFRLQRCLVEHKSKCPQGNQGGSIKDFEIIQCHCCKVWLEKLEHLDHHMLHCLENYNRLSHNLPGYRLIKTGEEDKVRGCSEISPLIELGASYSTPSLEIIDCKGFSGIDCKSQKEDHFDGDHMKNKYSNIIEKEYKCSECSYQTNYKSSLKRHLNTHNSIKPFECDICKRGFTVKYNLELHVKNKHSSTSEKEYKCSECSYQTNDKSCLKRHLNTHNSIKPFECDICQKGFTVKCNLELHVKNKHSNTSEKEYKCSECSFRTELQDNLNKHLNTHKDITAFECDICKKRFNYKISLQMHVRNHHSDDSEMEYKCSECHYQTNYKRSFKLHLYAHNNIKPFECDICKKRFTVKRNLKLHVKNEHSNTSKCSECSYQTNLKGNLKMHLNTHNDIKPFECDVCQDRFNHKISLQMHVRNHHSNVSEKEYKCSECSYRTNYKNSLKLHLYAHNNIKPFECDICKKGYTVKCNLKLHVKNEHSNTNLKEYKCSECSYQTNCKSYLKMHLNTHNDIKPFECDICNKRFNSKSNLKKHISNQH